MIASGTDVRVTITAAIESGGLRIDEDIFNDGNVPATGVEVVHGASDCTTRLELRRRTVALAAGERRRSQHWYPLPEKFDLRDVQADINPMDTVAE